MTVWKRFLRPFRRPAHIGWGGDPRDIWVSCWTPDNLEIR